jgi:hypothetical protein
VDEVAHALRQSSSLSLLRPASTTASKRAINEARRELQDVRKRQRRRKFRNYMRGMPVTFKGEPILPDDPPF